MTIPHIQIRQTPARLGIDADIGKQSLEQKPADIDMKQIKPQLHIETTRGNLDINQDRAWDALALGGNLETMSKIYSMASDMALQGLAKIVERGNRMADIHLGGNPIAEFALDWQRTFPEFDFKGEASFDNVDITYTPAEVNIDVTPGRVELNVQVNRPTHHYERGKLDIYVSQYNKVEITPPKIDLML